MKLIGSSVEGVLLSCLQLILFFRGNNVAAMDALKFTAR